MSERGFFAVDRGVWDHPSFAPEPFTEREAWFWMLSAAAWEAKSVRVGRAMVELKRGQLAFSLRFLAEKFRWSESRVRRRLNRMVNDALVYVESTREATLITICNYDKYQTARRTDDTSSDAQNEVKTADWRRKEEQINNLTTNNSDVVVEERATGNLVTPEALTLTEKLLVVAGHSIDFWPPGWCGAPMRVQTWLSEGWSAEIIVATVTAVARKNRGPPAQSVQFFEKAIAAEIARQAAPLPVVEVKSAEHLTVYHGTSQVRSGQSLTESIRRELAQLERSESADLEVPACPVLRISN